MADVPAREVPRIIAGMDARERLASIAVASPCTADWGAMKGDNRVRHCGSCRQNVYNFDQMGGEEIAALLDSQERVCGRFFRRADGTIVTSDCSWVWASAKERARGVLDRAGLVEAMSAAGGAAALFLVAAALFALFLFQDNIRKWRGGSATAGGIGSSPTLTSPRSSSTPASEKTMRTFDKNNVY